MSLFSNLHHTYIQAYRHNNPYNHNMYMFTILVHEMKFFHLLGVSN